MNKEALANELMNHVRRVMDLYKRRDKLEIQNLSISQEIEKLNLQITEERMIVETLQFTHDTNGFVNLPQQQGTPQPEQRVSNPIERQPLRPLDSTLGPDEFDKPVSLGETNAD